MSRGKRDDRAVDTAPVIPAGPEVAKAAGEMLEWRRLAEEATGHERAARAIVEPAAMAAYLQRRGEVLTWQIGPAIVSFRESYSALPEELLGLVPELVRVPATKIGRSPDWAKAEALCGPVLWAQVAEALGVTTEWRPAKGSIAQLARAGDTKAVEACLAVLSAPQMRRATPGGTP